jgi:hypothetical protein
MRKFAGVEIEATGKPQQSLREAPLEVKAAVTREMLQEVVHRYQSLCWMVFSESKPEDEEWYRQARTIIVSTDSLLEGFTDD